MVSAPSPASQQPSQEAVPLTGFLAGEGPWAGGQEGHAAWPGAKAWKERQRGLSREVVRGVNRGG